MAVILHLLRLERKDYHKYYDLAKDFVDSYGEKSTSEFEIYFTVTNNNQDYNAKLTIPLVNENFKIEKSLDNTFDSFKINKTFKIDNYVYLIINIIGILLEIILIIYTIKYSIKNSLSSTKYERFINNILLYFFSVNKQIIICHKNKKRLMLGVYLRYA